MAKTGKKRKNYRLEPERLMYSKPCKTHNHHNADGYSVRVIGGPCVACHEFLPPGLTDIQVDGIIRYIEVLNRMSDEERRVKHIEQQTAWNKRNAKKVRGYVKTFNDKPERKKYLSEREKAKYAALTPEEKKVRNDKSYARTKELRQLDPEKDARIKAKLNARYQALTPEEKLERRRMQKVYIERRKEREKDQ